MSLNLFVGIINNRLEIPHNQASDFDKVIDIWGKRYGKSVNKRKMMETG